MRRLGRLGSAAAITGMAVLLLGACGHAALTPAPSPTQVAVPTSISGGTAVPATAGGQAASGDQLNQIDNQVDNQLSQIDNQIGQANQGLSTSEGDPTK
jgi:hypothetical protein